MEYTSQKAQCQMCNANYTRQGITRHLQNCLSRQALPGTSGKNQWLFHICVSDKFNPDYFLHLLVRKNVTLGDLDDFFRRIWLECCGHMSAFEHQRYGDEIGMSRHVDSIFNTENVLSYRYEFGTTTELDIKSFGVYEGSLERGEKIRVLARNGQPLIPCDQCGKYPGVEICTECQWSEGGWLCEKCVQTHECDDEMRLPVVNSPRTGVCGYTGD